MWSAYHLARAGASVALAEMAPGATSLGASQRSLGSLRRQFTTPENVQLSAQSYDTFRNAHSLLLDAKGQEQSIGWTDGAYCFLGSDTDAVKASIAKGVATAVGNGATVDFVDGAAAVSARLGDLVSVDGIGCAAIGTAGEGWFDPWMMCGALRRHLATLPNVTVMPLLRCVGFSSRGGGALGAGVDAVSFARLGAAGSGGVTVRARSHVVLACGPWSGAVAALAGLDDVPVEPRRRSIFVVHTCYTPGGGGGGDAPPPAAGAAEPRLRDLATGLPLLLIDASGAYVRAENATSGNGVYVCGMAPGRGDEDPTMKGVEAEVGDCDAEWWESRTWPALHQRLPALFSACKQVGGWSGFYDYNTFDCNGIIGAHPACPNLIVATGFSGHGIQQSPAVGRAVAEIAARGRSHSIDLTRLSPRRVREGRRVFEEYCV